MPLEFKDALKNGLESYQCTWNLPDEKKGIQHFLTGLKKQVITLKNATVGIFYDRDQDIQFQWNGSLNWIEKKIDKCEKWADFPAKKEKDFLNKLNLLSQDCDLSLNALTEMQDYSEKNAIILENIHYKFTVNKEQSLELFKEVETKIQKLKAQIELQDPLIKNAMDDSVITQKLLNNKIYNFEESIELQDPFIKNSINDSDLANLLHNNNYHFEESIELQNPVKKLEHDSDSKKFIDNLILRIKKTLSKSDISIEFNTTFKKDEKQLKMYETLKNAWLTSLIKFKSLEVQIEKSLLEFATLPIISKFSTNLQNTKLYFNTLNRDLESFSVATLAKGFKEKYQKEASEIEHLTEDDQYRYMRPLNEFFLNIAFYKINLNKFLENDTALTELSLDCNKYLPDIKTGLLKISEFVNSINANTEKESLDFVDENMKNEFIKQRKISTDLFNDFFSNLENSWNQCCLDLNEVKFQKKTFADFKWFNEKTAWCHLLLELMQSTIRNLRKTENNRFRHPSIFNQQCEIFKELCKLILQTNKTNSNENIKILDIPTRYYDNEKPDEKIEGLFPSNPKHSLKNEYDSLMSKAEAIDPVSNDEVYLIEDLSSGHIMGNIGLIWSSVEKQKEVFKEYQKQKTAFDEELKKHQEKIKRVFNEILPNMCMITTKELNWEGKTLSYKLDSYYDDHFTEAYYPESKAGKALQIVGGFAANTIKWASQTIVDTVHKKLVGSHSEYQQEELPMADETFEFTPLISPFDEMKKSI